MHARMNECINPSIHQGTLCLFLPIVRHSTRFLFSFDARWGGCATVSLVHCIPFRSVTLLRFISCISRCGTPFGLFGIGRNLCMIEGIKIFGVEVKGLGEFANHLDVDVRIRIRVRFRRWRLCHRRLVSLLSSALRHTAGIGKGGARRRSSGGGNPPQFGRGNP